MLVVVGVISLASTGCMRHAYATAGTGGVVVYQAPPQRQVVVQRPVAPYANANWVEGHYQWNGGQYVWIDGYYVQPRAGYTFYQPSWQRQGTRYIYNRGGWGQGGRVVHYVTPPQRAYAPRRGVVVGRQGGRVYAPRRGVVGRRGGTVYAPRRGVRRGGVIRRGGGRRGVVVRGARGGTVRVR